VTLNADDAALRGAAHRSASPTKRLAAALAAMDCDIITDGGPGLMQAANEGASFVPRACTSS